MFAMLRMKIRYTGWRCTFGLHKAWFTDASIFFSVQRCARCGHPESKTMLAMVEAEKTAWKKMPKGIPLARQESWVFMHIGKPA